MLLKDYLPNINKKFKNLNFSGLAFNSKEVKKNYIFIAIKGDRFDGNNYINDAIKNGAKIIISSKFKDQIKNNIIYLKQKNPRQILSNLSSQIFKKKPQNLIAVTGTNGKTSIANFYYQILKKNKKKVASFGTLGISGKKKIENTSNTTFDPIKIGKNLNYLEKKKINNVILEASSHGLKQHRLDGLKFDVGIFTNLSRDHLDYHKTLKDYLNAKLILFKKLMKKGSFAIFDEDIKYAKILKNICKKNKIKKFTIGELNGDLLIEKYSIVDNKQELTFSFNKKKYNLKTQLIGKIQIKNLLMSILAAHKSNIKLDNILKSVENIKAVPGRFEEIGNFKNNSIAILDYAHTPDALKTCVLNIKEQFKHRKVNLVFGCGGDRDKPKRSIMGKIANDLCDKIYLTDDNPRTESPKKIRNNIKAKILKSKLVEIPSRKKAIEKAIKDLRSDEILIVAGKGHENYQEYKTKKFFSDKACMIDAIHKKNKKLSKNLKVNIINEYLNIKINNNFLINKASINSKDIKKNNIFFGIKGKNIDGNKFADEALKKKASICILEKNYSKKNPRKIFVKDTLKTFSNLSCIIRKSLGTPIVAITGSAGKTSLKELIGQSLNTLIPTSYSKKSFNNQYGVPLSLFNIDMKHKIGVFEIGMDKKGEIQKLSNLIRPDIGVITNISYAHIKNFNSIKGIAEAKAEIIKNIASGGRIILNADDVFYNFFKERALNRGLKIISFSIKNKSDFQFIDNKKNRIKKIIEIKANNKTYKFKINKDLYNYKINLAAAIAVISNFIKIDKMNKNIFKDYIQPPGRGDLKKIKIKKKTIQLIDESYNSNPLSLKFSIEKFDKIETRNAKYLLLGDMLELGKFSKKLHSNIANNINKTQISKVYVYGKDINYTFNKLRTQKKGKILKSNSEILRFISNEINNNDYLMVKGSNSTGLNEIIKKLN